MTSSARRNHYLRRLKGLPVIAYPDLETALARFRLMPREGEIAPATLRMIAEKSLGQTSEGRWTMKFDRDSFLGSDGIDVLAARFVIVGQDVNVKAAERLAVEGMPFSRAHGSGRRQELEFFD